MGGLIFFNTIKLRNSVLFYDYLLLHQQCWRSRPLKLTLLQPHVSVVNWGVESRSTTTMKTCQAL